MTAPLTIHVVDPDHQRRAKIASCAYAIGHHAEIYSGFDELAALAPEAGIVIALDDQARGGIRELLELLEQQGKGLSVVATSTQPTVENAVAAVKSGALDYIEVPLNPDALALTLEKVANDADVRSERSKRRWQARERLYVLSPRERDVLSQMAKGLTNKEIGKELQISPRTVEIHRNNALTKLKARHSAEGLRIWFESELDDDDRKTPDGNWAKAS